MENFILTLGISTEWCIAGLLLVVVILVLFGIDQYKVRKNVVADDEEKTEDFFGFSEVDEAPAEEETVQDDAEPVKAEDAEEDELAKLLKAYIELGTKGELSVEEEFQYVCLSQQLARNYVCVGYPDI